MSAEDRMRTSAEEALLPAALGGARSPAPPCAASPGGQLPTYWLVLQQLSAFPSNVRQQRCFCFGAAVAADSGCACDNDHR